MTAKWLSSAGSFRAARYESHIAPFNVDKVHMQHIYR